MRLDQIMSTPVKTIDSGASAAESREVMQRAHIQHLVVLRGRQIAGVLCNHDLRGAQPGSTAEDLMSSPPVTSTGTAEVRDAARLLRRRDIGCLPVMDGRHHLAGIVTTSDLLGLLGKGAVRVQPRTKKWVLSKRGPTHHPEPLR
jgi:acetoin utilization protein AcuB